MDVVSYLLGKKSSGGGAGVSYVVVNELPTTGETGIIYLVPKTTAVTDNVYNEYMWIENDWELIGDTQADLSDYQKIIQYSTIPTASADNLGKIIQYIGTTTNDYTNGYFYECVSDGQDPATYSWSNINVQTQPDAGGSVYALKLPAEHMSNSYVFTKTNYPEIFETLQKAINDYFNGKQSVIAVYWGADNPMSTKVFVPSTMVDVNDSSNYDKNRAGTFRGFLYPQFQQQTIQNKYRFFFYMYSRLEKQFVDNQGYTSLGVSGSSINLLLDMETKEITDNGFQFQTVTGGAITILSTDRNYTTPYTPLYNGSPATKKYVDEIATTYSGYDATKTQVLKNINGVLTWVDE